MRGEDFGVAGHGKARPGPARRGGAGHPEARIEAWQGGARRGMAGRGRLPRGEVQGPQERRRFA